MITSVFLICKFNIQLSFLSRTAICVHETRERGALNNPTDLLSFTCSLSLRVTFYISYLYL